MTDAGPATRRYQLVLFDFDGTLADSLQWFGAAVNELADELGFRRVEAEAVETLRGLAPRQIMKALGLTWWKVPAVSRRMRELMARDAARIGVFPGVPEMLRALADAGLKLGLVTSNAEANVRRVLGPDSARLFAHWSCGVSLFGKAARFRGVVREARVLPREVICIGDEQRDHEAARAAGVDFGAVTWGFNTRAALTATRPALVFERVDEIARVLTRLLESDR